MPGPVSDTMPSLPDRMRALAAERPDIRDEFNDLADKVDAAVMSLDARKTLGAWARARRRWCEVTGEPLVPGMSKTLARLTGALKGAR